MLAHKVREVADGRVFTGEVAKNLGLVDQLGNLPDAIELAGRLGGIKGKIDPVYLPKEKISILSLLLGNDPEEILESLLGAASAVPAYLFTPGR
jgi:protease-4